MASVAHGNGGRNCTNISRNLYAVGREDGIGSEAQLVPKLQPVVCSRTASTVWATRRGESRLLSGRRGWIRTSTVSVARHDELQSKARGVFLDAGQEVAEHGSAGRRFFDGHQVGLLACYLHGGHELLDPLAKLLDLAYGKRTGVLRG